jgi:hypothetical protein
VSYFAVDFLLLAFFSSSPPLSEMKRLLQSPTTHDMAIKVSSSLIGCHRVIVGAQSYFFQTMLSTRVGEAKADRLLRDSSSSNLLLSSSPPSSSSQLLLSSSPPSPPLSLSLPQMTTSMSSSPPKSNRSSQNLPNPSTLVAVIELPDESTSPGFRPSALHMLLEFFYSFDYTHMKDASDCLNIVGCAEYLGLTKRGKPENENRKMLKHCE